MARAKVSSKEQKEKKELAKQILEFYGHSYNDWLHEKHLNYITENVSQYVADQEKTTKATNNSDNPPSRNNKTDNFSDFNDNHN